jgi:hypothetical protein
MATISTTLFDIVGGGIDIVGRVFDIAGGAFDIVRGYLPNKFT